MRASTISRRCSLPGFFAGLTIVSLVSVLPLAASQVVEIPLTSTPFAIELDGAIITVEITADIEPRLAVSLANSDQAPAEALDLRQQDGWTRLVRHAGGESKARPIIELQIDAAQRLLIKGTDLQVTINEAPREAGEEEVGEEDEALDDEDDGGESEGVENGEAAEGDAGGLASELGNERIVLELFNATAELTRVTDTRLDAAGSEVLLHETSGLLVTTLQSTKASFEQHEGRLSLRATQAEISLNAAEGNLEMHLEDSDVSLRGGHGHLQARTFDATLLFSGWQGPVEVRGMDSEIEARGNEEARGRLLLEGEKMRATVAAWRGLLDAKLIGGSLSVEDLKGRVILIGDGTEIELDGVTGPVSAELYSGASARMTHLRQKLQVKVENGSLEGEDLAVLHLTGVAAAIDLRQIERLRHLELSNSELELDLSASTAYSPVKLTGQSHGRITMSAPCQVQVEGASALGNRVTVTGCELLLNESRGNRFAARNLEGQRTRPLEVEIDEETELEIEASY